MNLSRIAIVSCLLTLAPAGALGQAPDAAAERARLANQRIQAEADRRAREEQAQQAPAPGAASEPVNTTAQPGPMTAPPTLVAPAVPVVPVVPAQRPEPTRAIPDEDLTTRALEQLRDLGKLKDAGYLTDEEFQRIKARIIDRQF
jgi:hypothetical protein